jgi:hypothetical protein
MKRWTVAALLALASSTAMADNLDTINNLNQTEFEGISKDLTAAFSYKAGSPAESLGVTGFDVGVAITSTSLDHTSAWTKAMSTGDTIDTLIVPKLYIQKGLPFDIDVGGYYFTVPNSNIEAWGGEIKYAFISGNMALPAVAVRGAITTLTAGDQLDFSTRSVDLSVSKSILFFTPYAGVGRIWADSTPKGTAAVVLKKESIGENRGFIGFSLTPGIFTVAMERDSVGGTASYNLKLGFSF